MEDESLLETRDIDAAPVEASALPDAGTVQLGFEAHRRRIDERLAALLPRALPGQTLLDDAMRDAVLAPGKRLRPIMTVLVSEALGGPTAAAVDAGCAVEMVHAASLVLDDLPCMDDASLRRGRPTVHVAHGEDVAVLAAVAALSGAFRLLAEIESLSPTARIEAVSILTGSVGLHGLVGGQFNDLRGGRDSRPIGEIATANGLKTGALFCAAAEIGAVAAGAPARARQLLCGFAAELGHAFQLLDDVIDSCSSLHAAGKDVGKDAGKSTIVALIGRGSTEARIERHVAGAEAKLTELFGPSSRLHAFVGGIVEAARTAGAPSRPEIAAARG
ncbi:polyprenyl synthetase family protein [Antarcticirhabdus aurantiaca]|uniref:Polyprenyl synthetase family protein n=1 Tax=Antarcticirhabdus aurantiaca TaxID=2606717 RepID=A0ACD4NR01_9HYPH|nr:polyprenyl synthetase family protein [Antarcticirhabdus aurantiaca]WAJ29272.1 polyprenyl synthetase family protein [Jeongeuplla avenae]